MTIYEHLDVATRKALGANKPVVHRQSTKHKEKLSQHDLRELMGMNRDRYKKVNGKIKRK